MKKLFVLMVLVVAMVAAPLFADVTDGGWAGDFTYKVGGNFTDPAIDAVSTDLDLSLSASAGEYTTFSVGIAGDSSTSDLTFSGIKMTQDFSSMVGLDTFKYTVGSGQKLEVTEYETFGIINHVDSASGNSFLIQAGSAGVTLKLHFLPTNLFNDADKDIAAEVIYAADAVSANVAYLMVSGTSYLDAGAKFTGVENLTVTGMFDMDMTEDANTMSFYGGVQYAFAPVTAKAGFGVSALGEDDELMDKATVGVGLDVAATDELTLKAGLKMSLAEGADPAVDASVAYKFDTVEYKLGVSYMAGDYTAAYGSDDVGASEDFAVSFAMDVDF